MKNIQIKNIQNYLNFCNNKKIGIIGLARSGLSLLQFLQNLNLHNANIKIFIYDDDATKRKEYSEYFLDILDLNWNKVDFLILSPGIPKTHPAYAIDVEKISDIEFYYQLHNKILNLSLNKYNNNSSYLPILSNQFYIAITGTNGKSTITSQVSCMLKIPAYGNIGNSIFNKINYVLENKDKTLIYKANKQISELESIDINNIVLLEVSSFQIDLQKIFKPNIIAITNITEDHLDRYASMQDYIESKLNILNNATSTGVAIINVDDDILKNLFKQKIFSKYRCKILFLSLYNYIFDNNDGSKTLNSQRNMNTEKSLILDSQNIDQTELDLIKNNIEHYVKTTLFYIEEKAQVKITSQVEFYTKTEDQAALNIQDKNTNSVFSNVFLKDEAKYKTYLLNNYNYRLYNKIYSIIICYLTLLQNKIKIHDQYFKNLAKYQEIQFSNQLIKKVLRDNYEISIINDSKGTNPASTAASLKCYDNICLIAGGVFKSSNLEIITQNNFNIIKIFLYGKDKEELYKRLYKTYICEIFETLEQAYTASIKFVTLELKVKKSKEIIKNNKNLSQGCFKIYEQFFSITILFSPMCASFDNFQSFYHRGLYFNELVDKISI